MVDNLYRLQAIDDHIRVPNVYFRSTWTVADPWTFVPHLHAVRASETLGPSLNQAVVQYEYGDILGDDETFDYEPPLNFIGKFVKIEWTPHLGTSNFDFVFAELIDMSFSTNAATGQKCYVLEDATVYEWNGSSWNATAEAPTAGLKYWIGIVTDEHRDDHNAAQVAGTQTFTCHGLDWLLTRRQILDSVVEDGASGSRIQSGLTFNNPRGPGRRAPTAGPYSHVFDDELGLSTPWTALQIAEYLIETQMEMTTGDLVWQVSPSLATQLSWYVPNELEVHGRTVFDVLNQLIAGRRGITWWVEVDDAAGIARIRSETLLPSDLALPVSGTSVQKNQEQVLVEYDTYDNGSGVRTPARDTSYQRKYNQVVVEGARRGAVCTFSITSGEIQKDWSAADETTYATAAVGTDDYPTDKVDQEITNDGHRSRDEVCRRVYSQFRIKPDWNLRSRDGNLPGINGIHNVLLKLEPDGTEVSPVESDVTWINGIKIEHYLPLLQGVDYSDTTAIVDNRPDDAGDEYRRMFSTFAMEPPVASPNQHTTWREYGETLHALSKSETDTKGAGITFNATVRPLDSYPGFVFDVSAPPHVIALNHFNPATAAPTNHIAQLDYEDMAVTCYVTFPNRVRVSYPSTPTAAEHDVTETLVIRLGDIAHLDCVAQDTVIGISGKRIVRAFPGPFYVRDDRQLMRDVARMAWEWYGTSRKSFSVDTVFLTTQLKVGQLVKTVNGDTVDAVVSSVAWDFRQGTTSIKTQFGELDFREFVA